MRGTTFPAPVFDTDDDDGNRRHEEAEVTANTAAFPPSANTVYSFWQDWSRWQYWGWDGYQCTDWRYDGGSGSWKHLSQLSAWAGEWNAQEWTTEYKTTTYSAASLAAGASVNAIREDPVGADTTRPSGGTEMPPLSAMVAGVAVTVDAAGGESDVRVLPPSVSDLPSYQQATATRAESVTAGDGPYDATITLRHPISADALAAIDQVAGVTVIWYEAIGALADGSLLTISGTMESLPFLKATFRAEQAAPMGIVAAEMMLADARAFEHVDQHEDVLLVDMTGEYVKRQLRPGSSASETIAGDRVDIVLDDIYWQHAGLFD